VKKSLEVKAYFEGRYSGNSSHRILFTGRRRLSTLLVECAWRCVCVSVRLCCVLSACLFVVCVDLRSVQAAYARGHTLFTPRACSQEYHHARNIYHSRSWLLPIHARERVCPLKGALQLLINRYG